MKSCLKGSIHTRVVEDIFVEKADHFGEGAMEMSKPTMARAYSVSMIDAGWLYSAGKLIKLAHRALDGTLIFDPK